MFFEIFIMYRISTYNFQKYLNRLTSFDKYFQSATKPTINVTDVDLSIKEMFEWIFSGLNVLVSQCYIDSVHIAVQPYIWSNDTEQFVETATITIYNSSFGSLDLNLGTNAHVVECYIHGELKSRTTLIIVNNSDISIQNCHFEKIINENGSSIMFGHNNSHITIDNSVFKKHNSSKGVIFLQNNSSMHITSSTISQNVAFTVNYSTITLNDRIHATVNSTVFSNNLALVGGALYIVDQCRVMLTDCIFSSNKANIEKVLNISNGSNLKKVTRSRDQNNITSPIVPTISSSVDKKTEAIDADYVDSILNKKSVIQGDFSGVGRTVLVAKPILSFYKKLCFRK